MATTSRSVVRKAIAAALEAELTTVETVVNHQASTTGDTSPMLRVMSAGSDRPPSVSAGNVSSFYIILQAWVFYGTVEGQWTEAQAEDALDAIEQEIADWVDNNQQSPGVWKTIRYAQRSRVDTVQFEGEAWLVEDIILEVRAHDP